jgi:MFS family permease
MSLAAAPTDSDDPDSSPPAPADRIWTRAFTDLVIAQSLFGFAYAVFLLLPKVLAVAYGASARDIGFVMAAFGVLSLAVIPAVPPVIGRLGRRQTMRASCLLLGASALGFVLVTRAGGPAALLRGLHGVAWSLFFAAGMSLVAEAVPPGRLGQAIGLYGGAALAMNAVAPAVAEPIAAHFGARAVFVLSAAVALGGAWFCHRLPAAVTPAKRPSVDAARAASSGGLLARVLIVLTVGGLAAAGMFTFVAPFSLAHGIAVVRGFFIAYTATALAVRIGGARLTDRLGHQRTALVGGVGYGLTVVAMGLFGPRHLVLLGGAFGLAHGIVFPALMALILESGRPEARPRLLALANGAINVGIVGVGMLGAVAERAGYPAVFVATGAITFAAGLLLSQPLSRSSASST